MNQNGVILTLVRLLSVTSSKYARIWTKKTLKKAKVKSKMNMNNQLHYIQLCNIMQNQGKPFQSALDWILSQFNDVSDKNNATNKARAKKVLTAIYEEHINGKISEVKSTKINSFFTNLGWS